MEVCEYSSWNDNEQYHCYFFFQAEDGIRDLTVTGVQTCALPIWPSSPPTWCWTPTTRRPSTPRALRSGGTPTTGQVAGPPPTRPALRRPATASVPADRKSTRLNSSHSQISYAVFCLKKKKTKRFR